MGFALRSTHPTYYCWAPPIAPSERVIPSPSKLPLSCRSTSTRSGPHLMATRISPPLAPDQKRLFACFPRRRTDLRQPRRQSRARDLAAAILGACAARGGRFRLHPLQSGEARPRRPRAGLAIFLVSLLGAPRCLSGRLGRRSGR